MSSQDIVIKKTSPLRIARATDKAPGFGPVLAESFERIMPAVVAHLERCAATPGLMVAWYEETADDGSVIVHGGFDIGDQDVGRDGPVEIVELPVIEVASVVHRGSMDQVTPVYEALVRWIDDREYRLAGRSRELYLEWHDDDASRNITELQMPIAR